MRRFPILIILLFVPLLLFAQAAGGQIKRPVKKLLPPSVSKTVNISSSTNSNNNNAGKSSGARANSDALLVEEMFKRGDDYYYGRGVTRDYSEAVKWYRMAADLGHVRAQYNLGNHYYKGEGVSQDYSEAVKWYRRAAEQGNSFAQNNLGDCFYHGRGVVQDYSEAVRWYRKAVDQGYASAQFNLGYCYYYGKGTSEDKISAKNWMEKAAANGYAYAQRFLLEHTFQTTTANRQSSSAGMVDFTLYGTKLQVRFDVSKRIKVRDGNQDDITKCLDWLESSIQEPSEDCQRIKSELNLSDWAFVKMLDKLSVASLGNTNEAVLLMSQLMVEAGYDVRLAKLNDGKLRLLYYTDATVYGSMYFQLDGRNYYLYGSPVQDKKVVLSPNSPEGKPVDFRYQGEMLLAKQQTEARTLKSAKNPDFSFTVQMNKNLLEYYSDVPPVCYNNNFMTRWATLYSYPLERQLKESLVDKMKQKLVGMSQKDAVQQLLWWVATSLEYKYDEDVWGGDRAFYAEETLFYPYADAEDRAILFSRLVRDVLGLDVALVYYPGHLATAVRFTDAEINGSSVVINGHRFVICDPTYIGSDVGEEMPNINTAEKRMMIME